MQRRKCIGILSIVIAMVLTVGLTKVSLPGIRTEAATSFAYGADVSWVPAMEYSGYKWYHSNGQ